MVESPHEAPINDFPNDPPSVHGTTEQPMSLATAQPHETIIDIDVPIDVTIPRDTTNIFYDYSPEIDPNSISSYNQTRMSTSSSDPVVVPALPTVMPTESPPSVVIDIGAVPRTPTTTS